jgi:hypothetical protein
VAVGLLAILLLALAMFVAGLNVSSSQLAIIDTWTWPWETGQVVNDLADSIAGIAFGGILAILGILILTGKVPLPGGPAVRILGGFGLVALGGTLILGVKLW